MGEEPVRRVLKSLGLTGKEAEVYIFLAKHGMKRTGEVSKGVKTDKSEVYRVLKSLQSKSLVEKTLEAPTRFKAIPFEAILDSFVKTKREEAASVEKAKEELLNYFERFSKTRPEVVPERFVVFEGYRRIYSKILELIEETKTQLSFISTLQGLMRAEQFGLFEAAIEHPLKSSIQFRFLSELSQQTTDAAKSILERARKGGVSLRARNPDLGLKLSPRMVIRDEEEIVLFITPVSGSGVEKQVEACLWTNCKDIVRSFSVVFEDLWNNSTEFQEKTVQAMTDNDLSVPYSFVAGEKAKKRYNEALDLARERISIITSSSGLADLSENWKTLKDWLDRGLSLKIMAPITGENFFAARKLAELCLVKHVPEGYLQTTLVDGVHLFHFWKDQTFYVNDAKRVAKIENMIDETWRNAEPPAEVTLASIINPPPPPPELSQSKYSTLPRAEFLKTSISIDEYAVGTITERDVINKIINAKRITAKDPKKDINTICGSSAQALIHPPDLFKLPDMIIHVIHADKQSSFGAEDMLVVDLKLETPIGYKYVPVVHVTDNPETVEWRRFVYAKTPAGQNSLLVSKDQFQVRVQGNTLFAGWTIPIKLFPQPYVLPPSCLLFDGYGKPTTGMTRTRAPSGRTQVIEFNRFEAFVTFFHPSSKYSGPGTHGIFDREFVMTAYPPPAG